MWIIDRVLTWWKGQTLNTQIWTMLHGEKVGEDDQGNIYYQTKNGKRRWVIYNGVSEASRVPVEWHGWLHHTFKEPPTKDPFERRAWELPHQMNLTGTSDAYRPKSSILRAEPVTYSDYDAWHPDK